jgi:hypothetical protein
MMKMPVVISMPFKEECGCSIIQHLSPSTALVPCMGLYLVAAFFFNPCVNQVVFLILVLSFGCVGECAGPRWRRSLPYYTAIISCPVP